MLLPHAVRLKWKDADLGCVIHSSRAHLLLASFLVALKVRGNSMICLCAPWFSMAYGLFIDTRTGEGGGVDGINSEYFL